MKAVKCFSIILILLLVMCVYSISHSLSVNAKDSDIDGLTDEMELNVYKSNPYDKDSDNDGIGDGFEVLYYKTNVLSSDSDQDGLSDYDEVLKYGTNPTNSDSDGDSITDGDEVNVYFSNPHSADSNKDSLLDDEEIYLYHTDPNDIDSDNDGMYDYDEIILSTNPNKEDSDNDGLKDGEEVFLYKTDPNNYDSDNDGISDFKEVFLYGTNPNNADSGGVNNQKDTEQYLSIPLNTETPGTETGYSDKENDDKKDKSTKDTAKDQYNVFYDESKKIYGEEYNLGDANEVNDKNAAKIQIMYGGESLSGAAVAEQMNDAEGKTLSDDKLTSTNIFLLVVISVSCFIFVYFSSTVYQAIKKHAKKDHKWIRKKKDWEEDFEMRLK